LSSLTDLFSINPLNPSLNPMTWKAPALTAVFPIPRMAAFNPGVSPPEVRTPMCPDRFLITIPDSFITQVKKFNEPVHPDHRFLQGNSMKH
jgi:hypothetical protein